MLASKVLTAEEVRLVYTRVDFDLFYIASSAMCIFLQILTQF